MSNHDIVLECVEDVVDTDHPLTADTPFAQLEGWDSVHALRLVVVLERAIGTSVDFEEFMACTTIGELASLVDQTTGANV